MLALLLSLTLLQSSNLAGTYACEGVSETNEPYTVTLTVVAYGHAYQLAWTHETELWAIGVGFSPHPGEFTAAYTAGRLLGVVAYTANANGQLEGTWTATDGKVHPERCRRGDPA